jgi:hypothetical protein
VLPTIVWLLSPALEVAPKSFPQSLMGDTVPLPGSERRHGGGPPAGRTVFLNFDGQTLDCQGPSDNSRANVSRLACAPESITDVPPFNPAGYTCGSVAACKETIRAMLTARWAEWNIRFVTERPKQGSYEMSMIGGSRGGVILGIAPLDCNDANLNTISFAFAADVAGLPCPEEALTTTISHELSHALGLCHNDEEDSLMFPMVVGCAQTWVCGGNAGDCNCSGKDVFCPSEYLPELLGPAPPDTKAPVVHVIAPLSGLHVPAQLTVRALVRDDRTLQAVEVEANAIAVAQAEPDVSGLYSWSLPTLPGGHARLCVVGRDAVGNEGVDCINVTVDPQADCMPGDCCCGERCCEQIDPELCDCAVRLPDGEPCSLHQDCRGGLCADDPTSPQADPRCTESCAEDAECPPGLACLQRDATGRGECWSYVAPDGVGQPCQSDPDCRAGLSCAFPDGCIEQPPPGGVGDGGTCLGEGFCSRPCGPGMDPCPASYACADVGGGRVCRFAGIRAQVGGGCAVGSGRAEGAGRLCLLLALCTVLGLARRR